MSSTTTSTGITGITGRVVATLENGSHQASQQQSSFSSWSQSINFDYLAPTVSAIVAGVIHHIGREKKELTMMDFLLIISPSVPVISALILKLIALGLAVMAAGIEGGAKLGAVGKTIVWLSEKLNIKRNEGVYKDKAFDEYGRMIFHKYTVDFDMNKKVAEWQKQGLHVSVIRQNLNALNLGESYLDVIFQRIKTCPYRVLLGKNMITIFRNFYDVLEFKGDGTQAHLYVEMVIAPDDIKKLAENPSLSIYDEEIYKNISIYVYIASTKTYGYSEIFRLVHHEYFQENRSSFRLSRIHNEHSDQIRTAIKRYKLQRKFALNHLSQYISEKIDLSSMRPVSLNFCFAGPPGTSKTYAARAIAKELNRDLVEIDLSKIVYEEEFLEIFKKYYPGLHVFLLDEIDLMCPSRDLDDKLIKMKEEQRIEKLGMDVGSDRGDRNRSGGGAGIASDDGSLSDSESDGSLASTQKSNGRDSLNHEVLERLGRVEKRLNMVYHILDVLHKMLANILGIICYGIFMCYKHITNEPIPSDVIVSHTDNKAMVYKTLAKYCNISSFILNPTYLHDHSIDSSVENQEKPPFTLRTLLNFISGGKTPEGLIIIATTNRPDKLDPALIRPGRLRLVEFKNLRRCDAVALLSENFVTEEEKAEIEEGLDRIGYQDYAASGALLEAIMSSSNSVEEVFVSLDRELRGEGAKADINYIS